MKSKDDLIVALSVGKENGDFIRWEKPGNKTSKWWKYRRLPALMFILQTIDSKGKNSVLFRMLPNLKRKKLMGSGSFWKCLHSRMEWWTTSSENPSWTLLQRTSQPQQAFLSGKQDAKFLQNLQHKNVVTLLEFIISHTSPPMLKTELLDCDLRKGTSLSGRGWLVKFLQVGRGQTCFIRNRGWVAVFLARKKISPCRLVDSYLLTNTRSV